MRAPAWSAQGRCCNADAGGGGCPFGLVSFVFRWKPAAGRPEHGGPFDVDPSGSCDQGEPGADLRMPHERRDLRLGNRAAGRSRYSAAGWRAGRSSWRPASASCRRGGSAAHPDAWEPGVYSIVRFTLRPEDDATRFVIDHDGIPPEWQDHIQTGYPTFYQSPLARYFGR